MTVSYYLEERPDMLEVRNLTKKYGNNTAVKDLSFSVEEGQICALLGLNGAGKSTTMNMMTGYLAPTSGTVTIDGFDIVRDPLKAKKCLGYLPEIPPLYPDLMVWEYLMFCAELKKVKKADRKDSVSELLKKTGTEDVKDRLIRNLSKGYRQRVGIASALTGYPKLIILDEPTAGLDPGQIIEIRELILSLKDRHTVILSSHILQEISAVCDHILVISHGELKASGTPEEIEGAISAKNTLSLHLQGEVNDEVIKELLSSVPGVEETELDLKDDGTVFAEVKSGNDVDIRKEVFWKMADNKITILDMHSSRMSLEDVYLSLTGEGSIKEEKLS